MSKQTRRVQTILSTHVPPSVFALARAMAKANGVSVSSLTRMAVEAFLHGR